MNTDYTETETHLERQHNETVIHTEKEKQALRDTPTERDIHSERQNIVRHTQ